MPRARAASPSTGRALPGARLRRLYATLPRLATLAQQRDSTDAERVLPHEAVVAAKTKVYVGGASNLEFIKQFVRGEQKEAHRGGEAASLTFKPGIPRLRAAQ